MALPVTITGVSLGGFAAGPYKSSGGNYYFVGRSSGSADTLNVFKATDPSDSWSSVTTDNIGATIGGISGYQDGDNIHIACYSGTGSSRTLRYRLYSMSSESFTTSETVLTAYTADGGTGGGTMTTSIVFRPSDSQPVIFHQGPQVASMGSDWARVVYSRRTGTNTWTTNQAVDAGGAIDFTRPEAVLGSSNRIHLFWNQSGGSTVINHRTLTSANALQTASSASNMLTGTASNINTSAVSYVDGADTKIVFMSSNPGSNFTARFTSADTPTLTTDNTDPFTHSQGLPGRLFVDETTVWVLQRNNTDNDLYVNSSTNQGDTWGTQASTLTATVSGSETNLSLDGKIYQRGSEVVIPYVVDDNGTIKYNEYVVRTAGASIEPSLYTNTQSFFTPTVTPGAVTLTPSLYTNDQTFFTPTVVNLNTVTPDLYTNTQTFFDPTVTKGAVTLTPALFTNTNEFFTPTVTAGTVNISPDLYTDDDTFFNPSVTNLNTITPDLYTDADTFFTSTVTNLSNLTPDLYTNTQTFFTPTVSAGGTTQDLQPDLYTNTNTFFSHTVTAGAVTLTPDLYTNNQTFFSPTVSTDAANINPDLYTNNQTFFNPTVTFFNTLTPDLFNNTTTFFSPTITTSYTLTPDLFTDGDTLFDATVTSLYTLSPALHTDADTFFSPSIATANNLLPDLYFDADTFFSPTVTGGEAPQVGVNSEIIWRRRRRIAI